MPVLNRKPIANRIVGIRATARDLTLAQRAAKKLGIKRNRFIVSAMREKAEQVLAGRAA